VFAKRELFLALKKAGVNLVDIRQKPHAILAVAVTQYKSGRRVVVVLGEGTLTLPGGQTAKVNNPVIALGGKNPSPTLTLNNPQIMSESCIVNIAAQLRDTPSGDLIWARETTYESLDIRQALTRAIQMLAKSLAQAAPRLQHHEPGERKI
jgi:hypothetical protein